MRISASLLAAALLLAAPAVSHAADLRGDWTGTLSIPNGPSFRLAVQLFDRADGTLGGNVVSPDQGRFVLPVEEVRITGDGFSLKIPSIRATLEGTLNGDGCLDATLSQGQPMPVRLCRGVPDLGPVRSQTPPVDPDYDVLPVTFANQGDGIVLSGTVTKPRGAGPWSVAVIISGSGPADRDGAVFGHRTYQVLAHQLTLDGLAVLRFDKRGVKRSTGSFAAATTPALARDAAAAVAFVRSLPFVDPDRIGLIGHSEGSIIAALAGPEAGVDFIISLAGPGQTGLAAVLDQDRTESLAAGATDEQAAALQSVARRIYAAILEEEAPGARETRVRSIIAALTGLEQATYERFGQGTYTLSAANAGHAGLRAILETDAPAAWRRVSVPVLALNGDRDALVAAETNLAGIAASAPPEAAGLRRTVVLPGVNHMLQPAVSGGSDEYAVIEETISPDVLRHIAKWLRDMDLLRTADR